MKKEVFSIIKKESLYVGILFLLAVIIFKIAFFKEDTLTVFRNVLSLFWLFAIPGYIIMLYWRENLEFIERFVIGISLSAAIIGIFSYYFGIIGLNIRYHSVVLPLILIIIGLVINLKD